MTMHIMTKPLGLFLTLTICCAVSNFPTAPATAGPPLAIQETGDDVVPDISRASLAGRRFKFYWKSADGGGFNGIATLKANGVIEGIGSPNESTWNLDADGNLLFRHADGHLSTRYTKVRVTEGVLCFEGPFLLREGIVHLLIETEGSTTGAQRSISPDEARNIKYSSQQFLYLDVDENVTYRLKDGTARTIRLVSVDETTDRVIELVRSARVVVAVDGKPLTLTCAPYVMPTIRDGLRIQADTTSEWMEIPKRVQLSVWDAAEPIVDTSLFRFPLPDYRLFSLGTQAYNEPVHLGDRDGDPDGQRFYHNYGVDLAGYEGRQKVVSCIEGIVVQRQEQEGTLAIRDDRGVVLEFDHLDAILADVQVGTAVRRGQWVGMLGKRGASGNFAHLHVGIHLSEMALMTGGMNRNLNLYPWLVAAYQATAPGDLLAVARPHHAVRVGEEVVLDGSNSLAAGSEITSYRWEFHDEAQVTGPIAKRIYEKPGCYIAALWIADALGRVDVDFCRVKVFSDPVTEPVMPTLFVTCKPAGTARVGQQVSFRIWPQSAAVGPIQIDFGDGARVADYRPYSAITHAFSSPGLFVVSVSAVFDGVPIAQKIKVIVHE